MIDLLDNKHLETRRTLLKMVREVMRKRKIKVYEQAVEILIDSLEQNPHSEYSHLAGELRIFFRDWVKSVEEKRKKR